MRTGQSPYITSVAGLRLALTKFYDPTHPTTHTHKPVYDFYDYSQLFTMGAIFSAIGGAINAVISAIAEVLMIIVSVIVTIIVTIFDVIFDILCCNCFGGRTRRTGTHRYRFGGRRGGAAATY